MVVGDHLMVDRRCRRSKRHHQRGASIRRLLKEGSGLTREGGAARGERRERRAPVAGGETYVNERLGAVAQLGCDGDTGSGESEKQCERGSISEGGEGLHCGGAGSGREVTSEGELPLVVADDELRQRCYGWETELCEVHG